jgi:prepilin-type N-terminal cleavage/methylation domain-containing protein
LKNYTKGFSLVELSIVIVIISLLIGAVLMGQSLVDDAKVQDAVKSANDLSEASLSFKNRYHYLPGDLPVAENDIAGVSNACKLPITTASIGNGSIDTVTESSCASEELLLAGNIKSPIASPFGKAWLSSFAISSDAALTPCANGAVDKTATIPRAVNVILMEAVPIKQAQQIDIKMDDGNYKTGQIRASDDYASTTATLVCIAIPL